MGALLHHHRCRGRLQLAEFGLVFLLFMIGLELSWERLARLRRLVFGLGLAQVVICTARAGGGAAITGSASARRRRY